MSPWLPGCVCYDCVTIVKIVLHGCVVYILYDMNGGMSYTDYMNGGRCESMGKVTHSDEALELVEKVRTWQKDPKRYALELVSDEVISSDHLLKVLLDGLSNNDIHRILDGPGLRLAPNFITD